MCGGGAGGTGLAAASGPRLEVNAAASSSSPNSGLEGSRYGSAAVGLTSGSGVEVSIGPELGGGLSLGGGGGGGGKGCLRLLLVLRLFGRTLLSLLLRGEVRDLATSSLLLVILSVILYEPTSHSAKPVCAGTASMCSILHGHTGKAKPINTPATRGSSSFKSRVDMWQAPHQHSYMSRFHNLQVLCCNSESLLQTAMENICTMHVKIGRCMPHLSPGSFRHSSDMQT